MRQRQPKRYKSSEVRSGVKHSLVAYKENIPSSGSGIGTEPLQVKIAYCYNHQPVSARDFDKCTTFAASANDCDKLIETPYTGGELLFECCPHSALLQY